MATLQKSDVAHVELFYIYFQPLLPVLIMLWLWGINVRYFERTGVRYDVCFSSKDQKFLLNSRQIFQASPAQTPCTNAVSAQCKHVPLDNICLCLQSAGLMTTVVLTSAAVFCAHCMLQQDKAAALHPPLMYACILALLLLPWDAAFKVCTPETLHVVDVENVSHATLCYEKLQ